MTGLVTKFLARSVECMQPKGADVLVAVHVEDSASAQTSLSRDTLNYTASMSENSDRQYLPVFSAPRESLGTLCWKSTDNTLRKNHNQIPSSALCSISRNNSVTCNTHLCSYVVQVQSGSIQLSLCRIPQQSFQACGTTMNQIMSSTLGTCIIGTKLWVDGT